MWDLAAGQESRSRPQVELGVGYFHQLAALGQVKDGREVKLDGSPLLLAGMRFRSGSLIFRAGGAVALGTGTTRHGSALCVGGVVCGSASGPTGRFGAVGLDVMAQPGSRAWRPVFVFGAGVRFYHYGSVNFICLDVCDVGDYYQNSSAPYLRPAVGFEKRGRGPTIRFEVGPAISRYRGRTTTADLIAAVGIVF